MPVNKHKNYAYSIFMYLLFMAFTLGQPVNKAYSKYMDEILIL